MSPHYVRLIRRILRALGDYLDRHYCTSYQCDAKLVLYRNGRRDCPHLTKECRDEMGGYA